MNPNNMMNVMTQFGSFMQNPMGMLSQMGLNMPANVNMNDPASIMQSLVTQGRFSQTQINQANQMANQIRNNPMFKNMFR